MTLEEQQRKAVLLEAQTWFRTPYHHQGRIKGVGVDCATLLYEVYCAVGMIPFVPTPEYPPDWHLNRNDERYINLILDHAHEVFEPKPGDIGLWKFGRCFSHGGIIVDDNFVIHAYLKTPVSLAERHADPLGSREVKYFSLWK